MKKTIASVAVLLFLSYTTGVQAQAYSKGNVLINAGIGIGTRYWANSWSEGFFPQLKASFVNPSFSLEIPVSDKISAGGVLAYSGATYKHYYFQKPFQNQDQFSVLKIKYTGLMVGARGSYHFPMKGDVAKKLDPYAGLFVGKVFVSVKDKPDDSIFYPPIDDKWDWGIHGGIRYYFWSSVGIYGELGYTSFSVLNLGLAFKL